MASKFVTITKDAFEDYLKDHNFEIKDVPSCKEYVYDIDTKHPNVKVRIYSSVDIRTNETRAIGKDAIRVVYWDDKNNKPLGKDKRINRVESKKTTIGDRINQRIDDFLINAKDQKIIDMEYVRCILTHDAVNWMEFAKSLVDQLETRGKLTDNQLKWVLGDTNPKGRPTMEAQVLFKESSFKDVYLAGTKARNFSGKKQEILDDENKIYEVDADSGAEESSPIIIKQGKEDTNDANQMEGIFDSIFGHNPENERVEEVREDEPETNKAIEVSEIDGTALVPTKEHKLYSKYPFKFFNPVQSEVFPKADNGNNMIIGANTSAGKTICAELLMDHTLDNEKRVIYLSPLKSLTQEKYEDWQKRYKGKVITILTGDYTLSEKRKQELTDSNIIVMTSEMMDSRTRKMKSEGNTWLMEVGLVVVDESHILSTERGHAVESGVMRFTKLNPSARILFLSATMPNVDELGKWLTVMNGKETDVIYSTWRPVKLNLSFPTYRIETYGSSNRMNYWETQNNKVAKTIQIIMSKPTEKFLCFVHDKGTGRKILGELSKEGVPAAFHSADLDMNTRLDIESSFNIKGNNGLRVLVSTSTLAWGRNLPARNVVICGINRGMDEVDQLDIIQMAGRAGRYGIDDAGFVFLVLPNSYNIVKTWEDVFVNPRPVTSHLNQEAILAFHTLAEVGNREITDYNTMLEWYSRSLAYMQKSYFNIDSARYLIEDMKKIEMIDQGDKGLFLTGLGNVSAMMYFSPYDIYAWYDNFDQIMHDEVEKNDLTLAWAIGSVPSNDMGYVAKDLISICNKNIGELRGYKPGKIKAVTAISALYNSLIGNKDIPIGLKTIQRNLIFDINRSIEAIKLIDKFYTSWESDLWKNLGSRFKYGIPECMIELVNIPGIGGVRAKKLYENGFKTIDDIKKAKKKDLQKFLSPIMVSKIKNSIEEI